MNKTKRLICESAIKLFSRKGFNKATMDEIAESAGIAKGTLYYHFKNKEEVVKLIIDEGVKYIREYIEDTSRNYDSPQDKLRAVCKVHVDLIKKYPDFFKNMIIQICGQEEKLGQFKNSLGTYYGFVENLVADIKGIKNTAAGDIEFIACSFLGVVISTVTYSLIHRDNDAKELSDWMFVFITRGING